MQASVSGPPSSAGAERVQMSVRSPGAGGGAHVSGQQFGPFRIVM